MTLAVHEEEDDASGDLALRLDGSWPNVQRFREIVDRLYPDCRKPCAIADSATYNNPPLGYNVPWNSLSRQEHEYAEVYMLGRLMWCVWEGMSAPQRGTYCYTPPNKFHAMNRLLRRLVHNFCPCVSFIEI